MDSKVVLVADDDQACRAALVITLRSLGVRAIPAADGVQALELATASRPRLIFMDLNMPKMDGLEATWAIYGDTSTAEIPIVAMSADCDGQRWRAFQASCGQWLKKPWVLNDVYQILNRSYLRTPREAVSNSKDNPEESLGCSPRPPQDGVIESVPQNRRKRGNETTNRLEFYVSGILYTRHIVKLTLSVILNN